MAKATMQAVTFARHGGPGVLRISDVDAPPLGPRDVVIEVVGAGVNNADVLQRQGRYQVPSDASSILGLEVSGHVVEVGEYVTKFRVGDPVVALLPGGGYADKVAVPAGLVLPAPSGMDLLSAAGLPEAACTVYSGLAMGAGLCAGETLLIHGGTSGIGTFAIQWAKAIGAKVIATSGSDVKCKEAVALGADVAINYRDEDFVAAVRAATDDAGVDVILDVVGGAYLGRNVDALASDGRLVIIGSEGGDATPELDLGKLMKKRASVASSTLRGRPHSQRVKIIEQVFLNVWPLVEQGLIKPQVHSMIPLSDAAEAHNRMEAGEVIGKIILATAAGRNPYLQAA